MEDFPFCPPYSINHPQPPQPLLTKEGSTVSLSSVISNAVRNPHRHILDFSSLLSSKWHLSPSFRTWVVFLLIPGSTSTRVDFSGPNSTSRRIIINFQSLALKIYNHLPYPLHFKFLGSMLMPRYRLLLLLSARARGLSINEKNRASRLCFSYFSDLFFYINEQ